MINPFQLSTVTFQDFFEEINDGFIILYIYVHDKFSSVFAVWYSGDMMDLIRLFLNRFQSKHSTYQTLFQVSNVLGLRNLRLDSIRASAFGYEPFRHSEVLKIWILSNSLPIIFIMLILRIWCPISTLIRITLFVLCAIATCRNSAHKMFVSQCLSPLFVSHDCCQISLLKPGICQRYCHLGKRSKHVKHKSQFISKYTDWTNIAHNEPNFCYPLFRLSLFKWPLLHTLL